jgi:uncharacterized protein
MDKRILEYISTQSVLTFCTALNNEPYCANCMYVYLPEHFSLVFSSENTTRHIHEAVLNNKVAGTILPTKTETGTVKGIQFTGTFRIPEAEILEHAKKYYYLKFPVALMMKGQLWMITLESIKMTDNTLGFGKKLLWNQYIKNEN